MIDVSIKALRELGISIYDRQGEMKPLQELMEELKVVYYKINPESKPLLAIELQDEHSVPKVFYKGEELTGKTNVNFKRKTRGEHRGIGGVNFEVDYFDGGIESVRVIGRKSGEFM